MDLYSIKPPARGWRACDGGSGDTTTVESRVVWAPLPLHPDAYVISDSADRARSPLRFTGYELARFCREFLASYGG